MFVPWSTRITATESNSDFMPTVGINNGEVVGLGSKEAWVTVVPKIANKSEQIEGGSVEEPVLLEL